MTKSPDLAKYPLGAQSTLVENYCSHRIWEGLDAVMPARYLYTFLSPSFYASTGWILLPQNLLYLSVPLLMLKMCLLKYRLVFESFLQSWSWLQESDLCSGLITSSDTECGLSWTLFPPPASVSPCVQWGGWPKSLPKDLLAAEISDWVINTNKFPLQSPNSSRDLVIPGFELSCKSHLKNSSSLKKKKEAIKRK